MQQTNGSVNSKGFPPEIEHFSPRRLEMSPRCWQQFSSKNIACEQALLFGQVKRVSRERASERRSREGPPRCCQHIACEQALLFGQATRASRERASEGPRGFAARSRALARLVSLAQIGEHARY